MDKLVLGLIAVPAVYAQVRWACSFDHGFGIIPFLRYPSRRIYQPIISPIQV